MSENEYDFYTMGIRYAKDQLLNLGKIAKTLGEKHGVDAKLQFEAGIASVFPQYTDVNVSDLDNVDVDNATVNFGVEGKRNNSYFDRKGTSNQFKVKSGGVKEYIEPKINDKDDNISNKM